MEKSDENGALNINFENIDTKFIVPENGMEKNSVCMIIPGLQGMKINESGLTNRINNSELKSIRDDLNIISKKPFKKAGKLTTSISDIDVDKRGKLFYGEYDNNIVKFIDSKVYGDKISCEIDRNMQIGLFIDEVAPKLKIISTKKDIIVEVIDGGSGIAKNGIMADFGSIILSATHLEDNLYIVKTDGIIKTGIHTVLVRAKDNCGNISPAMGFPLSIIPDVPITNVKVFPNPARNLATFRYKLGNNAQRVNLKIYDGSGRVVISRELTGTFASTISYNELWDLRNKSGRLVANGTYFYKIKVFNGDKTSIKRGTFSVLR
jgi:hypothetical protein